MEVIVLFIAVALLCTLLTAIATAVGIAKLTKGKRIGIGSIGAAGLFCFIAFVAFVMERTFIGESFAQGGWVSALALTISLLLLGVLLALRSKAPRKDSHAGRTSTGN